MWFLWPDISVSLYIYLCVSQLKKCISHQFSIFFEHQEDIVELIKFFLRVIWCGPDRDQNYIPQHCNRNSSVNLTPTTSSVVTYCKLNIFPCSHKTLNLINLLQSAVISMSRCIRLIQQTDPRLKMVKNDSYILLMSQQLTNMYTHGPNSLFWLNQVP